MEKTMTINELAAYCEEINSDCLHCKKISFCYSYSRFISSITPRIWNEAPAFPEVVLTEEGYTRNEN